MEGEHRFSQFRRLPYPCLIKGKIDSPAKAAFNISAALAVPGEKNSGFLARMHF
jgi:hypothetical protein